MKPDQDQIFATRFDVEDARKRIPEFVDLYKSRPLKINQGGMRFNHSFATWYMLRELNPDIVIESGVWKGHSTWLIEKSCPNAQIFCLDIDFSRLVYRSRNAVYLKRDFSDCDWSDIDVRHSVALFDDHQNAYERLKDLYWSGMRRAIFDDNYPCGEGDAYSLRHVLSESGYKGVRIRKKLRGLKYELKRKYLFEPILRKLGSQQHSIVAPNSAHRTLLLQRCVVYQEFPAVVRKKSTSRGEYWSGNYASEPPLLAEEELSEEIGDILRDDPSPFGYGYITYVELNP